MPFQSAAEMFKITLADFHQASACEFNHDAAGSQCATISVMAAILAAVKCPTTWSPSDLNSIIREGDNQHVRTLQNLGWPTFRTESKLDIDELLDTYEVNFGKTKMTASIGLKSNSYYGYSRNLGNLLGDAIKSNAYKSFVIRILDRCLCLLLTKGDTKFALFDPHVVANDRAGIVHLENIEGAQRYLENILQGRQQEQIDINPLNIAILEDQFSDMLYDDGMYFTSYFYYYIVKKVICNEQFCICLVN